MSRATLNVSSRSGWTISKLSSSSGRRFNFCLRLSKILIPTLLNTEVVSSSRKCVAVSTPTRRGIFKWRRASPIWKPTSAVERNLLSKKMSSCFSPPWLKPLPTCNSQKWLTEISSHLIFSFSHNNHSTSKYVMWEQEQLLDFVTTPRKWQLSAHLITFLLSSSRPTEKRCILWIIRPIKVTHIHLAFFFWNFVLWQGLKIGWRISQKKLKKKSSKSKKCILTLSDWARFWGKCWTLKCQTEWIFFKFPNLFQRTIF